MNILTVNDLASDIANATKTELVDGSFIKMWDSMVSKYRNKYYPKFNSKFPNAKRSSIVFKSYDKLNTDKNPYYYGGVWNKGENTNIVDPTLIYKFKKEFIDKAYGCNLPITLKGILEHIAIGK